MKTDIHPKYVESTIICACGNTWKTRSTKETVHLDICSRCHPYFTGEARIVDKGNGAIGLVKIIKFSMRWI